MYFVVMNKKLKNALITIIKISVALSLVYWLTTSGKLDLSKIKLLVTNPLALSANVVVWIICITLGAYRWKLLLQSVSLMLSKSKVISFQLIGVFFNTAMPGAVGGDVVKAYYVANEGETKTYSSAFISVLMDRIIGMTTVMLLGVVFITVDLQRLLANETIRPVVIGSYVMLSLMCVFLGFVFFLPKQSGAKFIDFIFQFPVIRNFKGLMDAVINYRSAYGSLAKAIFLSTIIQCSLMALFWLLASYLGLSNIQLNDLIIIYPIGTLVMAIPLAPGGLGVGHLAFEKLFLMVGAHGGANVFNLLFLGQMSLNLLGSVPFLLRKNKLKQMPTISP